MGAPRVGVIGAGRRRQGLGPFVVRDLVAAGAVIPCVLGRRSSSVDPTVRSLAEATGVESRGYVEFSEMLDAEHLDAVAVLSPSETHEGYLEAASKAGLHVLCEKPFLWECARPAQHARSILERFGGAERVVVENCPWPWTLSAWSLLHPAQRSRPPTTFEMLLEPAAGGPQMLADALPHALSLLQALVPGETPQVDGIRFEGDAQRGPMVVAFRFRCGGQRTACRIALVPGDARPRRAGFVCDGRRAERRVVPGSYEISFRDGERSVPVPDPMTRLVADFVARVQHFEPERERAERRRIADRQRLLDTIVGCYFGYRDRAPGDDAGTHRDV